MSFIDYIAVTVRIGSSCSFQSPKPSQVFSESGSADVLCKSVWPRYPTLWQFNPSRYDCRPVERDSTHPEIGVLAGRIHRHLDQGNITEIMA